MPVDAHTFKQVMAQWASGVTVVTSILDGEPVGMTVSSFASVSLHPPRILVCAGCDSRTHSGVQQCRSFAVHILSKDQSERGILFAGLKPEVMNRFSQVTWQPGYTGAPILAGTLAWLDCRVAQAIRCGDHTIFVGDVCAVDVSGDGQPLLYHNRRWCQLADAVMQ